MEIKVSEVGLPTPHVAISTTASADVASVAAVEAVTLLNIVVCVLSVVRKRSRVSFKIQLHQRRGVVI